MLILLKCVSTWKMNSLLVVSRAYSNNDAHSAPLAATTKQRDAITRRVFVAPFACRSRRRWTAEATAYGARSYTKKLTVSIVEIYSNRYYNSEYIEPFSKGHFRQNLTLLIFIHFWQIQAKIVFLDSNIASHSKYLHIIVAKYWGNLGIIQNFLM